MAASPERGAPTIRSGLMCRCPRCGKGRLFSGFLEVADACDCCGLDLSSNDSGDGPAVLIIMVLGFLVGGLALWTEVRFAPPVWLHMVMWIPLIIVGGLGMLRPFKGLLIAVQYKHRHGEDGGA